MADQEYEDEWAKKDDGSMPGAQAAADAGVAAGKVAQAEQADPDFNYEWPDAQAAADAGVATAKAAPEPAKPMSFKETFAARRKAGDTVFEWNGKKYTTDLKKSASPAKSATAGRAPAGRPAQPQSLTQKMGANFAAAQSAVNNMPGTADGNVRQALTSQRDASRQAYEQAASAEKSGTPVVRQMPVPAKAPYSPGDLPSVEIAPGKTILANGHMPERAPVVDRTPRRGYLSN